RFSTSIWARSLIQQHQPIRLVSRLGGHQSQAGIAASCVDRQTEVKPLIALPKKLRAIDVLEQLASRIVDCLELPISHRPPCPR
ncbi:MAG: hypothetical protein AAF892_10280, partial [Cyanobacteria bacterium P01_D01_bin.71]